MRSTLLMMVIGCSTLTAAELIGPRKEARAQRVSGAIVLDGQLDDAAWKGTPSYTGFQRLLTDPAANETIPPELQTSFQICYNDTTLYFGIRCNEIEMDRLHPYSVTSQWDAAMWGNDDIEIFLDPVGDRREKYQFSVDPNGAQCDLYFIEGGSTGKPYSAIWQVKTHKGAGFWSAEIAIPFASLHMRPSSMWSDVWVFSMARSRIGGGRQGYTNSKFSPTNRGYHDLANFGTLAGIVVDRSRYNLAAEKPTWRLEPADHGFQLHTSFTIHNTTAAPFQGELTCDIDEVGKQSRSKPLAIPAHSTATVSIDSSVVEEQGLHALFVRIADASNHPVLSARYDHDLRYVPLAVKLTQPNYRNGIYATQQVERISGTIQLGMPAKQVSGCIARVTLGSPLCLPRRVELPIAESTLSFDLPATDLLVGDHTLTVELLRPVPNAKPPQRQHAMVAETSLPLRRLPPAPDVEARIDDQGILLIDGKPTMLRGWYGDMGYGMPRSSLPQANLPHSTNFLMSGGSNAIWRLKDVSRLIDEDVAKLNQPLDEGLKARIRSAMAEIRGQRNVIGYYLADEPSYRAVPATYLKRVYDLLVTEDPYRLVMVVDVAAEDYIKACDAICPHPYQSPLEYTDGTRRFGSGLDGTRSCLTRAHQANDGSKAIWTMPQVFSYGGMIGRNPTLPEQRWIMYSGIANGATSLIPFMFCAYWNHHENRIAADAIFEELVLLEPFLTSRDSTIPATANLPTIDVLAKSAQIVNKGWKHTAIVAVNRSYDPCSARITVPALGKTAQLIVLRENRTVPVVDGVINDKFDRLGVHVYTTLEALPHLKTLADLAEEVVAPQRAALAAGNLLADSAFHWRLAATGASYVDGEGSPWGERAFTAGLRDGSGWFPLGKPTGDCVLLFDAPVNFSRMHMTSATIRDADLDIWINDGWKTIHQWRGQLLSQLEWTGPSVTTTRLRIAVKATRRGATSWLTPEIAELGIYK